MRPDDGESPGVRERSIRRLLVVLAVTSVLVPPWSATAATGAPTVLDLTWHARTGPSSDPVLGLTLTYEAPAGLSGGRVELGSVFHEILHDVTLEPRQPGTHSVDITFAPPGDKLRSWELIGLTLTGADGSETSYGFCELVSLVETREKPSAPRLSVDCLDGTGWVVYTVRVDEAPNARIWMRGVATRDNTYAGVGHVLQDGSGAVVSWGTAVSVAYPQAREGTEVSVAGQTVVDEPSPDPSAQPGTHRIVIGVGGTAPTTLVPGATYRWAAYYAVRPGHFDTPHISLEGSGLTVLDVQKGTTAGVAYGADFDHSVVVQREAADAAVFANGAVRRSFGTSTTCMFVFLGGRIADAASANIARIEGPSAPPVGGVVVAGRPGEYAFHAYAGAGQSWGQYVVAYADMPLTTQ